MSVHSGVEKIFFPNIYHFHLTFNIKFFCIKIITPKGYLHFSVYICTPERRRWQRSCGRKRNGVESVGTDRCWSVSRCRIFKNNNLQIFLALNNISKIFQVIKNILQNSQIQIYNRKYRKYLYYEKVSQIFKIFPVFKIIMLLKCWKNI